MSEESLDAWENSDWERLTTEDFFRGYSEADAIYDEDL